MACNIERPTPQALFDKYKNMMSATVLGGAEVIPESNEWYVTSLNYAMAEQFYAISEQAWREQDPRYACASNLIAMAARDGVVPRGATYAQGYLQLTGVAGSELPNPIEATVNGQTFVTSARDLQPTQIGTDGTAYIRVRSLVAGASGNVTGTTGRLNSGIPDISRTVTLAGGTFCNGVDAENTEAFRQRYISRLQYQPRATNQWMLSKLLEWPCATRAMVRAGSCCSCTDCVEGNECGGDCGCKNCGGKQEYYVMFDNTFECGIAPESVVEELQSWMFGTTQGYGLGQVEVGICGRIVPVTGIKVRVNLDIVACPTPSQLDTIENLIAEYFLTLEPSKPLRSRVLESIVANVIGAHTDFEVRLSLSNSADTQYMEDFNDGCDYTPKCDYLMCLDNTVNTAGRTSGLVIAGPTATAQTGGFRGNSGSTAETSSSYTAFGVGEATTAFRSQRSVKGQPC